MLHNNREAERVEQALAVLVKRADAEGQVLKTDSRVGIDPEANGGYCRYFPEVLVRSEVSADVLQQRIEEDIERTPALAAGYLLAIEVRQADPGVLVVSADGLGESGDLDPRCA
jgi:cobalamin biosynthesis protein CbiG